MANLSLKNKRILITGGSQGVGFAIARACCNLGAQHLVIIGRDEAKGQVAANQLSTDSSKAAFFSADLANEDAANTVFDFACQEMGSVDGLVNAAGITTRGSFLDGKLEDWDRLFAINARAPFFLMQAFIRHALDVGQAGSIVNISSMHTYCGLPEVAMYAGSKAAISTLTKNAAKRIYRTGYVQTPLQWGGLPHLLNKTCRRISLARGRAGSKILRRNYPLDDYLMSLKSQISRSTC